MEAMTAKREDASLGNYPLVLEPPMQPGRAALLSLFAAVTAAPTAASAAEGAEPRYRIVHVNDVDGSRMVWSHSGAGYVQDAMDARLQQKALLLLKTGYRHARTQASDFDVQAFLKEAMRCLPDPSGIEDCREVIVVAGDGTRSGPDPSAGAQLDRVQVVVQNIVGVMRYDFHIGDASPEADPRKDSDLSVTFHERPGSGVEAGPLPPFSGKFSDKQKEASAYWFGGPNSPWETSFRRATSDFKAIAASIYTRLRTQGARSSPGLQIESLPLVASLQEQGLLACKKRDCKARVLDVVDGRVWSMSDPHSVDSWALRSYADDSIVGGLFSYDLASRIPVAARATGGRETGGH